MIKIPNTGEINQYVEEFSMKDLFSMDMKPYMELFLYKKNEFIITDSEKVPFLIFIVKGKAKVFTTLSNGKSLLLCFYQDFMVLGDLEIMGAETAVTNVQTIEDTYCIGISFEYVKKYLLEDARFLRFICGSLGKKLYRCSKNSSINLLYSLENRLASYIYTTGERCVRQGEESIIFEENLTHIAELLGTSYRHLLRNLQKLCQKKVLKKVKNQYIVLDKDELYHLSADLYR